MILEERYIQSNDVGNIFKLVAEELKTNVNTQVIIFNDILKKLEKNNCDYNVYFHNYA